MRRRNERGKSDLDNLFLTLFVGNPLLSIFQTINIYFKNNKKHLLQLLSLTGIEVSYIRQFKRIESILISNTVSDLAGDFFCYSFSILLIKIT